MPVNIKGTEYQTVAERLKQFHADHPEACIKTKIVRITEVDAIIQAKIISDGRVRATGTAHEVAGDGMINATSHIENCETSAVGRALAIFGYAGHEVRSADEMSEAVIRQAQLAIERRAAAHITAVRENMASIAVIRAGMLEGGNLGQAAEAWFELSPEDKEALWLAPSKGGIFTTQERETLKSSEFRAAYYGSES
jgi:hypothetical protein